MKHFRLALDGIYRAYPGTGLTAGAGFCYDNILEKVLTNAGRAVALLHMSFIFITERS